MDIRTPISRTSRPDWEPTARLDKLKSAVADVATRMRSWAQAGRPDAAEVGYETLLFAFNALLAADDEAPRGWQRAALLLTDSRARLALDALSSTRLAQLQVRAAALLDLPDITSVASIADIQQVIAAAINIGAPRYNAGDIAGCCVIYWATIQSLVATPTIRGFPGYARAMATLRSAVEGDPPAMPLDSVGVDAFAWTLRHALDTTLGVAG